MHEKVLNVRKGFVKCQQRNQTLVSQHEQMRRMAEVNVLKIDLHRHHPHLLMLGHIYTCYSKRTTYYLTYLPILQDFARIKRLVIR